MFVSFPLSQSCCQLQLSHHAISFYVSVCLCPCTLCNMCIQSLNSAPRLLCNDKLLPLNIGLPHSFIPNDSADSILTYFSSSCFSLSHKEERASGREIRGHQMCFSYKKPKKATLLARVLLRRGEFCEMTP